MFISGAGLGPRLHLCIHNKYQTIISVLILLLILETAGLY